MVATGLAIGGGAVLLAPVALTAVGFGAGGVVAGSIAAYWQAMIGNVAGGSVFALLQSAGAAGISGAASAAIGTAGGTVGTAASYLTFRKETDDQKEQKADGSKSTALQQIGIACGYTVGIVILCLVAAILINCWMTSASSNLPDIRDPRVRTNIANIVRKIPEPFRQSGQKAVKSFWNSPAARSGGASVIYKYQLTLSLLAFIIYRVISA